MKRLRLFLLAAVAALTNVILSGQNAEPRADRFDEFAFRPLGPGLTSGRISDVEVDPKNPSVWYAAASSGNLWKTENRGNTWTPIFDTSTRSRKRVRCSGSI